MTLLVIKKNISRKLRKIELLISLKKIRRVDIKCRVKSISVVFTFDNEYIKELNMNVIYTSIDVGKQFMYLL